MREEGEIQGGGEGHGGQERPDARHDRDVTRLGKGVYKIKRRSLDSLRPLRRVCALAAYHPFSSSLAPSPPGALASVLRPQHIFLTLCYFGWSN